MPVEYLISDMNVTMPKDQKHTWANANKEVSFPIENRSHSSQQTFESFCRYLKHFCGDSVSQGMLQQKFKEIFSNFHILVWFALEENTPGKYEFEKIVKKVFENRISGFRLYFHRLFYFYRMWHDRRNGRHKSFTESVAIKHKQSDQQRKLANHADVRARS